MLQDLQVVQLAERLLHAFERAQRLGTGDHRAFVGNLQRVAQLLCGDADLVETFRSVDLAGVFDRAFETAAAAGDAERERGTPAVARGRTQQRLPHVFEPAPQLPDVDAVQPFEHDATARL